MAKLCLALVVLVAFPLAPAQGNEPPLLKAQELLRSGDAEGSVAAYTEAITADPKRAAAWYGRAQAYEKLNNEAAAITDLKKASELSPNHVQTLNKLAWMLLTCKDESLRDPNLALASAHRASSVLQHGNPGVLDTLALAFFENKRIPNAVKAQERAIELLPANASEAQRKNMTEALERYRAAAAKGIAPEQEHFEAGGQKLRQRDLAGALTEFERCIAINDKFAGGYYGRASVRVRQGNAKGAVADYNSAIRYEPAHAAALNDLADLLMRVREVVDAPRALRLATRACAATGHRNPVFLATLGAAQFATGAIADAVATQKKALALLPANANPRMREAFQKQFEKYDTELKTRVYKKRKAQARGRLRGDRHTLGNHLANIERSVSGRWDSHVEALSLLKEGTGHRRAGRSRDAEQAIALARTIDPKNEEAQRQWLAVTSQLHGNKNSAWPFAQDDARRRQTEAATNCGVPARVTYRLPNGSTLTFVLVPAGEFLMGSPESELRRSNSESIHRVRITRPFYMSEAEVTFGQLRGPKEREMLQKIGRIRGKYVKNPSLPMGNVSWSDCTSYCDELSRDVGATVWIPTEAQWEYACRAGTATAYNNGSNDDASLDALAWNRRNSDTNKHPKVWMPEARVGKLKRANAWGLYDMHGNMAEWCRDEHDREFYGKSPKEDPFNDPADQRFRGNFLVRRGGSYHGRLGLGTPPRDCRSAARDSAMYRGKFIGRDAADHSSKDDGLRVVMPIPAGKTSRSHVYRALRSKAGSRHRIGDLRIAARAAPNDPIANAGLAWELVAHGHDHRLDLKEALAAARRAAAAAPKNAVILDVAALCEYRADHFLEAADLAEQAVAQIDPKLPEAIQAMIRARAKDLLIALGSRAFRLVERGQKRQKDKDHRGALADFNSAIKLAPTWAVAYYHRARLRGSTNDESRALDDYRTAIRHDAGHADAHNAMAWLLLTCSKEELRDYAAAMNLAERAAQLSRYKTHAILDTLALAQFKNGLTNEAIATQEKAIQLLPSWYSAEGRKTYVEQLSKYRAAR